MDRVSDTARTRRQRLPVTPPSPTRSHLEQAFLHFLAERNRQLPIIDHPVGLTTIDAVLRYAYAQLPEDGDPVEAELRGHGVPSRR